jgi:YfiH family protein
MQSIDTSTIRRLGADDAIVVRLDGAMAAFGLGPPTATGAATARLQAAACDLRGDPVAVAWLVQVHGRDLVHVDRWSADGCVSEADALVTAEPNRALAVWTADCVPMLLASRRTIAAVHAGWRGCAAGVLEATVSYVSRCCDEPVAGIQALLGPAIGADHYQVGDEVVDALRARSLAPDEWLLPGSHVDLRRYATDRLVACGVPSESIHLVGGCTACDPRLASYRRSGDAAGRQWSLIIRSPESG